MHPHIAFYGGAETLIVKLVNYLKKNGIENVVITLSVAPKAFEISKEMNIITPKEPYEFKLRSTSFINAVGIFKELMALRHLIKENIDQFDVVNVHNFPATWSVFPNHWQKPVVWMCNEPPDLWNNPNPSTPLKIVRNVGIICDKYIVNKVIGEICVSDEYNYNRVLERYGRCPDIVHYGIEYDLFSKGDGKGVLERYNLHDQFILLQVGVLSPQKNQFESIKAIEQLKVDISNIKLILAGLGGNPYEKMLKEYVRNKGLDDYVIFTGHLSKQEIADFYQACNVAIFPIKSQGGWLAPFEALCAKKPVVVSTELTASDIIKREKIGIVTDDFAEVILDIYINQDKYYEIAERGQAWVRENLSWQKFCEKMVDIFYKTVGKGQEKEDIKDENKSINRG